MKQIVRQLLAYLVYLFCGLSISILFYMLYRYGIVYNWAISKGFFRDVVITGLYIFMLPVSCTAVLQCMFRIRKRGHVPALQLLLLGLCNIGLVFGIFTALHSRISPMPSTLTLSDQTLPYQYLLKTEDEKTVILQEAVFAYGEEAVSFMLDRAIIGDPQQNPYFSMHSATLHEQTGSILFDNGEEPISLSLSSTPHYSTFAPPNIIKQLWLPIEHLNQKLSERGRWFVLLLMLSGITGIVLSLWCLVCTSPRYGLHIWVSILVGWFVFFLYRWCELLVLPDGVFVRLQSALLWFNRYHGGLIVPGLILFCISLICLFRKVGYNG